MNRAKIRRSRNITADAAARLDALVRDPEALIAFHRQTFGGFRMEDDGDKGGDADKDKGSDGSGDADKDKSGDKSGDSDKDKGGADDGADLGFPKDTPVADMKPEQQAAYWRHQAKKHQSRSEAYRTAAGGKTADELKAEREEAARAAMTAQERAVDDAKRAAREETTREFGPKTARSAFELVLRDLPEKDRDEFIDDLDLSKFVKEDGSVDTAKVIARAEKFTPTGKGGRRLDFGGGKGGDEPPRGGSVAAVKEERRKAREARQSATSTS